MSTRSSIWYDEETGWHLYNELTESRWYVRLERDVPGHDVSLRIPVAVWAKMRQHGSDQERYLTMAPEVLRKEAEEWVDERAKDIAEGHTFARYGGALIADADWPRDKQIEAYIETNTPPTKAEGDA